MMRFVVQVVAVVTFLPAGSAVAQLAPLMPSYQEQWSLVRQTPGCVPTEYPDFILVSCLTELTLRYFSRPNNPAHPGFVRRAAVRENDGAYTSHAEGRSFGPDEAQPAFKKWFDQIADLNRQMRESIEREHRGGAAPK
ncbi:MAG: hypothetical protein EXQ89_03830 [Rhodospirillaceae bacterium]|nr:hypothetical protein [Rhodospirillaceae bacterium]